ncbi:MAG: hypothetical protein L0Y66_09315 [Myxococcaceae bacterium]|nr:hypothetical protein [Myxococcaceae bacterium]MCI0671435.1 hypothetical protein [Myxococcaceae bacterium]
MTAVRGKDSVFHLRLSLQEAALGTLVRPRIPFHTPCERCADTSAPPVPCTACAGKGVVRGHRDIEVQVPGGVDRGARLRLRGLGEPGRGGGPRGDLYIVCDVMPHPMLVRKGTDLFCEVVISPERARTGTTLNVPALEEGLPLQVPPSTQHGTVFSLAERGARALHSPVRGALCVRVIVGTAERPARGEELLARFPASPSQPAAAAPEEAVAVEATDAPSSRLRRFLRWALGGAALRSQ